MTTQQYTHRRLNCGVELAIEHLPGRRTVAFTIRVLTGMVDEPDDLLGLAYLTEQTISKGTQRRGGRELSDAFDAIGAQHGADAGREAFTFRCLCLPEFVGQAIDLHAEMLRTPTFPQDMCDVAIDLAKQELTALEDQPDELARRMITRHAYGPRLGRHPLGRRETLERINRSAIERYWRDSFGAARMQVAMAGAVDAAAVGDALERAFSGFGGANDGRAPTPVLFTPTREHQNKELEQQQICLCWPGVKATDPDYHVERLLLAVLSDGMSSRLFTEVREKLGLVYWVGAWSEHPRAGGMLFAGASTTPQRCEETYRVLLREIERVGEDLSEDELRRAKVGIAAKTETHGDITRARSGELASDLFFYGRPVPIAEKLAKIEAATRDDIRGYLSRHPRDRLALVTLGPREMTV